MNRSICFLTNAYPDFGSSHRGIFIRRMALLLKQQGYELSVVTPRIYRKSPCFERQDGIPVYRFPFFAQDKLLIEYQKIPYLKMILYFLTGSLLALFVCLTRRCSLLHVHWAIPTGLIGVFAKAVLRKPLLVTVHGSDLRMALERSPFLGRLFLFVCRASNHLTCVSALQKRELEKLGIEREKISVFPMGIDEDFIEAGKNRRRKGGPLHPVTILSNRNLFPIYNLSLLLRAIPYVLREEPEATFVIVGDGPERENLEEEAKKLKVNSSIRFLGQVSHEKMAGLLSEADIYVSTSLHDGTSVSLLEAMGTGAFPVVTDIAANKEWIVDGENGYVVPVDREAFLAQKIVDAIRDQTLLERGRLKNISMVEEKALWPSVITKLEELYSKL